MRLMSWKPVRLLLLSRALTLDERSPDSGSDPLRRFLMIRSEHGLFSLLATHSHRKLA